MEGNNGGGGQGGCKCRVFSSYINKSKRSGLNFIINKSGSIVIPN